SLKKENRVTTQYLVFNSSRYILLHPEGLNSNLIENTFVSDHLHKKLATRVTASQCANKLQLLDLVLCKVGNRFFIDVLNPLNHFFLVPSFNCVLFPPSSLVSSSYIFLITFIFNLILGSIKPVSPSSIWLTILPFSFIFSSIRTSESSTCMDFPILPFTFTHASIRPSKSAPSIELIILPFTFILVPIRQSESPHSMSL